uniref:Bax inhibitor 1 n=1 Tax=Rhabditophanes sp. KR3021 TaxID=114890 RepID=A0AC35TRS5_9BILA
MTSTRASPEADFFGVFGRAFSTLDNKLEKDVKVHLKKVYSTLAISLLAAMVGSGICNFLGLQGFGFLFSLGSIGMAITLAMTPQSSENENKRLGYLLAFAALTGCGLTPMMNYYLQFNPAIVSQAYLITFVVFGCFSLSALYAENTKYLHFGGVLGSCLTTLLFVGIFNIFFGSAILSGLLIWGGLAVNCGMIMFDTQLICEKRRNGNTDYIWHSVELFLDFINVFRYILKILGDKESNKKKRSN